MERIDSTQIMTVLNILMISNSTSMLSLKRVLFRCVKFTLNLQLKEAWIKYH